MRHVCLELHLWLHIRRPYWQRLLSMGAGYAIIPNLPVVSEIEGLKELPEDVLV